MNMIKIYALECKFDYLMGVFCGSAGHIIQCSLKQSFPARPDQVNIRRRYDPGWAEGTILQIGKLKAT